MCYVFSYRFPDEKLSSYEMLLNHMMFVYVLNWMRSDMSGWVELPIEIFNVPCECMRVCLSAAVSIRNGNSRFIDTRRTTYLPSKFIMPHVSQLIAINSLPETSCFSLFIPSNHSVYIARVEAKNRNGLNVLRGLHTKNQLKLLIHFH